MDSLTATGTVLGEDIKGIMWTMIAPGCGNDVVHRDRNARVEFHDVAGSCRGVEDWEPRRVLYWRDAKHENNVDALRNAGVADERHG